MAVHKDAQHLLLLLLYSELIIKANNKVSLEWSISVISLIIC